DEWLTESFRQPLSQQTREDVAPAARGKADDPTHRPRRIGLRPSDARHERQRGSARCQMQKLPTVGKFHFEPPSLARLCVLARRQAHREHRALSRLARNRHIATHHPRELAGDGKPETGAAEVLGGSSIGLAELLEQLCLLLCCHADASIGDGELDEVAAIAHIACTRLFAADYQRSHDLVPANQWHSEAGPIY